MIKADPIERADALLQQGRVEEALEISGPIVAAGDASHTALVVHSTALKAVHRHEEALACDREAVRRFPRSGVAWHNLAANLCDLGRGEEALKALGRSFALGLDSPLTWQVKARAHVMAGDVAGADAAFREALRRAPNLPDISIEYADFIWMARGTLAEAQAVLDRAFHAGAAPVPLLVTKAKMLESAGDQEQAAALLMRAAEQLPGEFELVRAAAQAALQANNLGDAERLARHGLRLAPRSPAALVQLAIVQLALGQSRAALDGMRIALDLAPADQSVLAWAATAARAAGDPLYGWLCDYETMVGVYEVEPPIGWASQADFLRDLGAALDRHHVMKEHPAAQSLRHGTQTTYLLTGSKEPAVRAFFEALDKPVRAHLAQLGCGDDPLRRRNRGGYQIVGAWSVRLRPGGFHLDHMHHQGWLSSAFYVATPEDALDREDRQGWLRLGQPPFRTEPEMPAELFVRPKPGQLVLFPSYMWHGTTPFRTEERRTTIAFDLIPA